MHTEGGEARAAASQPDVGRAIELHQFAFASGSQTALAMARSAAFAGRFTGTKTNHDGGKMCFSHLSFNLETLEK